MALNSGGSGGGSGAIRAGRAFVELFTKNNLAAGLNSAAKDLKAFGSRVSGLGRAFVGLGAAGAASLIPMANTLSDLAKQGSIANALGLTSEQFTGIAAVAKSVGNDTKEFIESLVTLGKLGTDAAAGTEQASQAFADLGLNANEFIKLRADEQFFQVFESLNKIQDPLKRTRALMLAFGEDGGKILLPLLGKSGDELRKMAAGFAISGEDMAKATAASKSYTDATTALSRAWQSVSVSAAPFVKMLGEGIAQGVNVFREWINANREVVVGVGLAVGGVTALGLGMMALGPAIKAVALSWGAFVGTLTAGKAILAGMGTIIAAPILALPAAAAIAWAGFTTEGQNALSGLAGAVQSAFDDTFKNLKDGWKSVVAAIGSGDLSGAFAVSVATFKVELQRISNFFEEIWMREKARANRASAVLDAINRSVDYDRAEREAKEEEAKQGAFVGPFSLLASGAMPLDLSKVVQAGGGTSMVSDASKKALQDAINEATAARLGVYLKGQWASLTGAVGGGLGEIGRLFGTDNPLAPKIAAVGGASRGIFGGSASTGFFGGSGGVGEKIAENTKKTVELLDKNNKLLGNLRMGDGSLMFVGGK